ncbi:HAD-IIB family hydrolase [Actibacterium lipolyticum]|nr:HAD-IIB family hydrolase [Actibacterium lipolyticum]
MTRTDLIVFSDLDGTLLDHDTYSYADAFQALDRLRKAGIPLVLASSKTAAEIAPLRAQLGFSNVPAIVENGSGLLEPAQDTSDASDDYTRLRAALGDLPATLRKGFQGFADWGPAGIARETGLPPATAKQAAQRQYSEPGLWVGPPAQRQEFIDALGAMGIHAREGGRFLTLSFGGTKAGQMAAVMARFGTPFSIALGDAPNDIEMLETADLGIVVANPHRAPLPPLTGEGQGRIRRTTAPGPTGWNSAVLTAIAEHEFQ